MIPEHSVPVKINSKVNYQGDGPSKQSGDPEQCFSIFLMKDMISLAALLLLDISHRLPIKTNGVFAACYSQTLKLLTNTKVTHMLLLLKNTGVTHMLLKNIGIPHLLLRNNEVTHLLLKNIGVTHLLLSNTGVTHLFYSRS